MNSKAARVRPCSGSCADQLPKKEGMTAMKANRIYVLALTLGLATTPALPVFAQNRDDQSRQDQGQYQYGQDRGTYQQNDQGQYGKDQDQNRQGSDQDRDRDQNNSGDQNWNRDHDNDRDQSRVSGEQDYTNSKYYKMGEQDGRQDRDKNEHRDHKRKFKNDNDRRAYEQGYNNAYGRQH
jgi:hypothetical protein